MVGLGETEDEIRETMDDIFRTGCRILTVGQYLQPTMDHIKASTYITPEKFIEYKIRAFQTGFEFVECDPLVRSSFHAEKLITAG
jgi:lipoic acid synthetase